MNPIEMLWSKVKALLCKWECRTAELLPKTVSCALCVSVNGIASAGLKLMDIACNLGNCYKFNNSAMFNSFYSYTRKKKERGTTYDYSAKSATIKF